MKVKYFMENDLSTEFLVEMTREKNLNCFVIGQSKSYHESSSLQDLDIIVVNGMLSLSINGHVPSDYSAGSLVFVPAKSRILMSNHQENELEIIMASAIT